MEKRWVPKNLDDMIWEIGLFHPKNQNNDQYSAFYHYTNAEAKNCISREDHTLDFRFSRIDKFLDKNEGNHILEPYIYSCGRLYNNEKINESFYKMICDIKKNFDSHIQKVGKSVWVLCYSTDGNSLYMKEKFAPRDGWIISVNGLAQKDLRRDFVNSGSVTFECFEVVYSFKKMASLIEKELLKLYSFYNKDNSLDKDEKLKELILNLLFQYSPIYKGLEYKEEREIRFIVSVYNEFHNIQFDSIRLFMEKHHLHLRLNSKYFLEASQNINKFWKYSINKYILTAEEIQKALRQ